MSDSKNNIWARNNNKLPKIFISTAYRLPTEAELVDINNYNLKAQDILEGFSYTIIGRGVNSSDNRQKIFQSMKMLYYKYPDNPEYKQALDLFISKQKDKANKKLNADAATIPATATPKYGKWVSVVMIFSVIGVLWMMAKNN